MIIYFIKWTWINNLLLTKYIEKKKFWFIIIRIYCNNFFQQKRWMQHLDRMNQRCKWVSLKSVTYVISFLLLSTFVVPYFQISFWISIQIIERIKYDLWIVFLLLNMNKKIKKVWNELSLLFISLIEKKE